MKFIFGLGNTGSAYERTRHNVGFEVVDRLARRLAGGEVARSRFDAVVIETRLGDEKLMLARPATLMNRSGQSVRAAMDFYKADAAEDLLVIVDDIHLPCGAMRMRSDGGDGGHNGLGDIINHLGGEAWTRLRVGVDEPPQHMDQAEYVLGRFGDEQLEHLESGLEAAVSAATMWIEYGPQAAMNSFNTRAEPANATDKEDQ